MKVTREEIDALVGVLDYYIPDLHAEIAQTARGALREEMKAEEARLTGLRQRLLTEKLTGRSEDQKDGPENFNF